ncbi:hypothetical protein [Nitrincola sp.]|uniref:hypothetical protein n=1 Tax=Nitrincola sp. TaxID=1926584 RepID=UPI003A8D9163
MADKLNKRIERLEQQTTDNDRVDRIEIMAPDGDDGFAMVKQPDGEWLNKPLVGEGTA